MKFNINKIGILLIGIVLLAVLGFSGAASAEDIYISSADEWMSKVAGKSIADNIIITGNIDLSGEMKPMITSLSGTLEGNGYTISNFDVDTSFSSYVGLISLYTGTHIANLTISHFNLTSSNHVGGLIGYVKSVCSFENCIVQDCNVSGLTNIAGGLVGIANSVNFVNCTVVNSCVFVSSDTAGGLVGSADSTGFMNCSSINCTISATRFGGGILGYGSYMSYFENCSVTSCSVSGSYMMGGLIGNTISCNLINSIVTNCCVSGWGTVGGLIGSADSTRFMECAAINCTVLDDSDYGGGLVGSASSSCSFESCISANTTVVCGRFGGGLVGSAISANFMNCTAMNCSVSGNGSYMGGIGGLIGSAVSANTIKNCTAIGCTVSSVTNNVGGLVGAVDSGSSLEDCGAIDCRVSIVGDFFHVGGLLGYTDSASLMNCTSVNCSVSGYAKVGGLIGCAETLYLVTLMNCTVTACNVSGGFSVGSLVGCTDSDSITSSIQNCTAMNCHILGSSYIGGLVGSANTVCFNFCDVKNILVKAGGDKVGGLIGVATASSLVSNTVRNCCISGNEMVGCLVGSAKSTNIMNCSSMNCSVTSSNKIGGLVGYASASIEIIKSNVTNCIISSGNNRIGGLIGYASSLTANDIKNCHIVNCTVAGVGLSSNYIGGFVGETDKVINFTQPNSSLRWSAIRGEIIKEDNIAKIVGSVNGVKLDFDKNVTIEYIWLNNGSPQTPKIVIAKSADTTKQGPENPLYFNDTTADTVPDWAQQITNLSGYGVGNQYCALAYVNDSVTYKITNSSVVNGRVIANVSNAETGAIIHIEAFNTTCGYHFDEWNVTNSTSTIPVFVGNFTMPASNVNAGANFTANITTVIFHTDDRTEDKLNVYNQVANFSANPIKSGFTFSHWNVSSTGMSLNDSIYVNDGYWNYTGDNGEILHVYANWTVVAPYLYHGWNVISTPKKLSSAYDTAAELFADVNTTGHAVLSYNAQTKAWEQVTASTKIEPLNAYWIYSNESKNLPYEFSSTVSSPAVKSVYKGWNAVSLSADEPMSAAETFGNTNWYTYLEWNVASQAFKSPLIKGASGTHADTNLVSLWTGGWLFLNEDGTYMGFTA